MTLQRYVDKEYPPTMTFDVETLEPTGVLKERVEIVESEFPRFFKGEKLLDLGCSKGFFSLVNADRFSEIVAIDHNPANIELCSMLNDSPWVDFRHTGFRDFIAYEDFDRIWLGNVAHHLFMEVKGWEWISKLAAYSNGLVLIEGPKDANCKDMKECIPKRLRRKFNTFMAEMSRHFRLVDRMVPTVSYTPDRYFMLFQRLPIRRVQLNELHLGKRLKPIEGSLDVLDVRKAKTGWLTRYVAKLIVSECRVPKLRFKIASMTPYSNGMAAEVYDGDDYKGWLEDYSPHTTLRYFEREHEVFRRFCEEQVFLSKLGYVDCDCATINWFTNYKHFDKNAVYPIEMLKPTTADSFIVMLRNSYRTINPETQERIRKALHSKDSRIIEQIFTRLRERY